MKYIENIPIYLLFFVLFVLDALAISAFRQLLFEIQEGQSSKKRTIRIYREQSVKDKLFLSYINDYITKYVKEFNFFHTVYIILVITLAPQYLSIIICFLFYPNIVRILCFFFIVIKGIICLLNRLQVNSLLQSKYVKK